MLMYKYSICVFMYSLFTYICKHLFNCPDEIIDYGAKVFGISDSLLLYFFLLRQYPSHVIKTGEAESYYDDT